MTGSVRRFLLELGAPIVSRLHRGEGFFYRHVGGMWALPDAKWPFQRVGVRRGWKHRYLMFLDLSEALGRRAYFTGRYYERALPALILELAQKGDSFVDIGANVGHMSLFAAWRVGRDGVVISFEPNPVPRSFLMLSKIANNLEQVNVRGEALGDSDGIARLNVLTDNDSGRSTIRDVPSLRSVEVPVRRSECVSEMIPTERPLIVKIDVEGYEFRVLKGLGSILDRDEIAVIVEITPAWLEAAGTPWRDVFNFMQQRGYSAFDILDFQTRFGAPEVRLRAADANSEFGEQTNVLFIRRSSRMIDRVIRFVVNG